MNFQLLDDYWFSGYDQGVSEGESAVLLQCGNNADDIHLTPFHSISDRKCIFDEVCSTPVRDVFDSTVIDSNLVSERHSPRSSVGDKLSDTSTDESLPRLSEVDISYVMSSQSSSWSSSICEDDKELSKCFIGSVDCDNLSRKTAVRDVCNTADNAARETVRDALRHATRWPVHGDVVVSKRSNEMMELQRIAPAEKATLRHQTPRNTISDDRVDQTTTPHKVRCVSNVVQSSAPAQSRTASSDMIDSIHLHTCLAKLIILGYEFREASPTAIYVLYTPQSALQTPSKDECCDDFFPSSCRYRCLCHFCEHVYNGEPLILRADDCRAFCELYSVHDDGAVRIRDIFSDRDTIDDETLLIRLPVSPCVMPLGCQHRKECKEAIDYASHGTLTNTFSEEHARKSDLYDDGSHHSNSLSYHSNERTCDKIHTNVTTGRTEANLVVPIELHMDGVVWSPPLSRMLLMTRFGVKTTAAPYNVRPFSTPVVFVGAGCGVPWVMKQMDSLYVDSLKCTPWTKGRYVDNCVGMSGRDVSTGESNRPDICCDPAVSGDASSVATSSSLYQRLDIKNTSDLWCTPLPRCYTKLTLYKHYHAHYALPCSGQTSIHRAHGSASSSRKSYNHIGSSITKYANSPTHSDVMTNTITQGVTSYPVTKIHSHGEKNYLMDVHTEETGVVDKTKTDDTVCKLTPNVDSTVGQKSRRVPTVLHGEDTPRATSRTLAEDFQQCSTGAVDSTEAVKCYTRSFSHRDILAKHDHCIEVLGWYGLPLSCDIRESILIQRFGLGPGTRLQLLVLFTPALCHTDSGDSSTSDVVSDCIGSVCDKTNSYMSELCKVHADRICTVVGMCGDCLAVFFDGCDSACVLPATINSANSLKTFFRVIRPDTQVQNSHTLSTEKVYDEHYTEQKHVAASSATQICDSVKKESIDAAEVLSRSHAFPPYPRCMDEIQQRALVNCSDNVPTQSMKNSDLTMQPLQTEHLTQAHNYSIKVDTPFLNFLSVYAYGKLRNSSDTETWNIPAHMVSENVPLYYLDETLHRVRDAYFRYKDA